MNPAFAMMTSAEFFALVAAASRPAPTPPFGLPRRTTPKAPSVRPVTGFARAAA